MSLKTKSGGNIPNGAASAVSAETLSKISKFSRRPLEAEEVYVFPVVLCDNEIDRDGERFTAEALHELAKLFLGKTGVFDHSMKGSDQTARIFETCVERSTQQKTKTGEDYTKLCAHAYMVRTAENESLIREIDGGIKKEVSVGCSVGKISCSVCGKPEGACNHQKGKAYGGNICHFILEEPTDAYEWSFVAVPAQPAAGVTKSFSADAVEALTSAEIIKKCRHAESPVTLSVKQLEVLADKIDFLEEEAKDGRLYRESIKTKVKKLWLQRLPLSGEACVNSVCDRMETPELLALQKAFSAADAPQLQLYSPLAGENSDDDVFKI